MGGCGGGNRSQIICPPTWPDFRDPDSWLRVLAQHHSVFLIPSEAKPLASSCPKQKSPSGDFSFGGCGGNRTLDRWLKRPLLYRLSYAP